MTFCVGLEAKALQITARWGYYHRDRSQTLTTAKGDRKLVWKRSQRRGNSEPIPLKPGKLKWTPDAEFPAVLVRDSSAGGRDEPMDERAVDIPPNN